MTDLNYDRYDVARYDKRENRLLRGLAYARDEEAAHLAIRTLTEDDANSLGAHESAALSFAIRYGIFDTLEGRWVKMPGGYV